MNSLQLANTVAVFQKDSIGFSPGQALSGLGKAIGGGASKAVTAGKGLMGKGVDAAQGLAERMAPPPAITRVPTGGSGGTVSLADALGPDPSAGSRILGGIGAGTKQMASALKTKLLNTVNPGSQTLGRSPFGSLSASKDVLRGAGRKAESEVQGLNAKVDAATTYPPEAGRPVQVGRPVVGDAGKGAEADLRKHYEAPLAFRGQADAAKTKSLSRLGLGAGVVGGGAYGASKLMGGSAPAGPDAAPAAATPTETSPTPPGAAPAAVTAAGAKPGPLDSVLGQAKPYIDKAQPYLDKARQAMGQAGEFAQANWKPIAGVGGGLLLAKLLHDRLTSKRREKTASEHPLVEGFLKRAVELQLDNKQLTRAIAAANGSNPAFAKAWVKASTDVEGLPPEAKAELARIAAAAYAGLIGGGASIGGVAGGLHGAVTAKKGDRIRSMLSGAGKGALIGGGTAAALPPAGWAAGKTMQAAHAVL